LKDAENYVSALFHDNNGESFFFHNISHTEKVVARSAEIAGQTGLPKDSFFKLIIAARFHDTGYLFADPSVHETKSIEIMMNFMSDKISDAAALDEISSCIMATKFPVHPETVLQKILCDADTYHFGTAEFMESNEKVFLELRVNIPDLDKKEYNRRTTSMLIHHQFYTTYCEDLLQAGKQRNIDWLILNND
jgi:hypothetical protein